MKQFLCLAKDFRSSISGVVKRVRYGDSLYLGESNTGLKLLISDPYDDRDGIWLDIEDSTKLKLFIETYPNEGIYYGRSNP